MTTVWSTPRSAQYNGHSRHNRTPSTSGNNHRSTASSPPSKHLSSSPSSTIPSPSQAALSSTTPSPDSTSHKHPHHRPPPISLLSSSSRRPGYASIDPRSPKSPLFSPRTLGMAEQRTTTPQARVSTQQRRKASGVERDRDRPTHSPSSSAASAMSVANGPRLKARVNPAEIVNPSSVSATGPHLRKTPSSLSGGGRSDTTPTYGRPRSPVSTSSRSSVGIGPATPTSATSQVGKTKPLVAKSQQASRSGISSTASSNVSTPTYRRPTSVVGGGQPSSSMSTPTRSPPRPSPPGSAVGSGPRQNASMATQSSASTGALPSATASPVPIRVHVRGSSSAKASVSSSPGSRSPLSTLGVEESVSAPTTPPASVRTAPNRPMTIPERHAPLSNSTLGHSNLMEVTPSWANETMSMHQPPTSSSLLSPSTLIPSVRPPTPPQLGLEDTAANGGLRPAFVPFGTATLSTESPTEQPSSNHSSPVRPALTLDPSPLRPHFPHLNLQHHPTASCPTSPVPGDRALLGSSISPRRPSRPTLPWHPHSVLPAFQAAPESPELRTVALPVMTPTRSPESAAAADDYMSVPAIPLVARVRSIGNGQLTNMSSMMNRRYSSSSGSGSDDYGSSSLSTLSINRQRSERSERDRLSGSTIAEDDDELDEDMHGDHAKLEAAVFSDEEKAKVNRKIADLEISNASLLAINRSLEATKAKQRTEILKLRRMLRESQAGLSRPPADTAPVVVGPLPSLSRVLSTDDECGGWGDDEMDDPELEARWDRLASLVGAMRKRGEDAVERGKEETKPAMQRVLGWLEVEALKTGNQPLVDGGSEMVSTAPSEADATEEGDGDGDGDDSAPMTARFPVRSRDTDDHHDDDNYHTDATGFTDMTRSTNVSAASNATQLAGEVLERGQNF